MSDTTEPSPFDLAAEYDDQGDAPKPNSGMDTMTSQEEVSEMDRKLRGELELAEGPPELSDFYANLAEELSAAELHELGVRYLHLYQTDKETRQDRDKRQKEALEALGTQGNERGAAGDGMDGGSVVSHPGFLKASIQYSSQIVTELLPPDGPVRTHVLGEVTGEKLDKAERKARHMNWQLTKQAPEFRDEFEQLQSQVPMGGCQFLKVWWDAVQKRPAFQFVPTERVFVPYETTYFYAAPRIFEEQMLTKDEVAARVAEGVYLDKLELSTSIPPNETQSEQAINRMTGRSQPSDNPDGLQTVVWASVTDDLIGEGVRPYILEFDDETGKVRCIYRNWKEDDQKARRLNWLIKFGFLAWRDAYDLSLYSVVSSLDVAATGALRALLDSALVNTTPTLLALEGANLSGQNNTINLTEVNKIEGSLNVDDIRKLAMAVPFNQPSPALFQLLGFLSEQVESMVRITLSDTAIDSNANTPVGTQLSRVEQGLKVFKAIHRRNHRSMEMLLDTIHTLNELYLDEQDLVMETGERLARRADYQGPLDVAPVSDPDIFSEQQRVAQVQAVAQRATATAQLGLYDNREVEKRILQTLKVPNYEELLVKPQEAELQNAVNENMMASLGRPVLAFPDQDHLAHLKTHVLFMQDPMFGANPAIQPQLFPAMVKHLIEHLTMWYVANTYELVSRAAGQPAERLIDKKNPRLLRRFDQLLAVAQPIVFNKAQQELRGLPQIIQQASQLVQQTQQNQMQQMIQMQGGPAAAAAMQRNQIDEKLGMARLQLEGQKTQGTLQQKSQELQLRGQDLQIRGQTEQQRTMSTAQLKAEELRQGAALEHANLAQLISRDQAADSVARRQQVLDAADAAADRHLQLAAAEQDSRGAQAAADAELQQHLADLAQEDQLNLRDNTTRLQIARENNAARLHNPPTGGMTDGD